MADTSLFSRLQRLFSSDVIIRNVGGKRLKVMDTARIQKYGNLATNSLYDIVLWPKCISDKIFILCLLFPASNT